MRKAGKQGDRPTPSPHPLPHLLNVLKGLSFPLLINAPATTCCSEIEHRHPLFINIDSLQGENCEKAFNIIVDDIAQEYFI